MGFRIDQNAFVAYLQQEIKDAGRSEKRCVEGSRYEYAMKFREQRFILEDLLIKINGSRFDEPFKVADGGFMVEENENL